MVDLTGLEPATVGFFRSAISTILAVRRIASSACDISTFVYADHIDRYENERYKSE
jgi:hypothetical protein